MVLSAQLHLRQNQSLAMTPQLVQSIQLLQMTHAELDQFIAAEIEKNPLLERSDGEADGGADAEPAGERATDHLTEAGLGSGADQLSEAMDANFSDNFPGDEQAAAPGGPELAGQWKSMGTEPGDGFDPDDFAGRGKTLGELVDEQIGVTFAAPAEIGIARQLAGGLDDAGYIDPALPAELAGMLSTPLRDVETVLAVLQTFDPPGLFARSLSECLAIQLRLAERLTPKMTLLLAHLELLARRDFATLTRLTGAPQDELLRMLAELRRLNPKPGAGFGAPEPETLIPDVTVRARGDGGWDVELNSEALPRLLVNRVYYAEVSSRSGAADQLFLSECLQSANWLIRSLDQRAQTILKVAREIVRQQDAFLMHGVEHLRPLTLRTVADAIGMHESTVSRVTSNKSMATPRGVYDLKYFFTVSIASAEGGDTHSAEAVRHRIKALIAAEDPEDVLSDDDLVTRLREGGIDIARRTVAKYRESLGLASSVQRRREKRALARSA